jgi:hypothetical protein
MYKEGQGSRTLQKTSLAADPSGRAVDGVGLLPLACWDCEFESRMDVRVFCEYYAVR